MLRSAQVLPNLFMALASAIGVVLLTCGAVAGGEERALPIEVPPARPAADWVPTLVTRDGELWAFPDGQAPVLLSTDTNARNGGPVAELAWHPGGHELLLVRTGPYDKVVHDRLVQLNLTTGVEHELTDLPSGIKGASGPPFYGPRGDWAYIEFYWALGQTLLVFEDESIRRRPSNQFLDPIGVSALTGGLADVYLEIVFGPAAPYGRILTGVDWRTRSTGGRGPTRPSAGLSLPDLEGLYLVDRDLVGAERLTHGPPPWPLGLGPGRTWAAAARCDQAAPDCALVIIDLASGTETVLIPAAELHRNWTASLAPDGTIALAMVDPEVSVGDYPPQFGALWLVDPANGSRRKLTDGTFADFSAFAWAPPSALRLVTVTRPAKLPDAGHAPPGPALAVAALGTLILSLSSILTRAPVPARNADALVWAEPSGAGETLWVALEPDWQPIRIGAAERVWGVVSPNGQHVIAQYCSSVTSRDVACEHWLGPLHGPPEPVGSFLETNDIYSDEYWDGPRHGLYEYGVGGSTTSYAGFSPDGRWVWWRDQSPGHQPGIVIRPAGSPAPRVSVPRDPRYGRVDFSADSKWAFIGIASGTVILALDHPELPIRELQGGLLRNSPDGGLVLVNRSDGSGSRRPLLLRNDGAVLAPREGGVLDDVVFLEREAVLVEERDGRWRVLRYDPLVNQETVVLDLERVVASPTIRALGSPNRRSFVVLLPSADNPPADSQPYYGRTIRLEARLYSATGELLRDFGPAVHGCNSTGLQYSANGRYLLVARPDRDSLLVDLDSLREESFPSGLLSPGLPPGADVTAVGTLWTPGDSRPEGQPSGAWVPGRGFQEVEPPRFRGLSPSGRYALTGMRGGQQGAVATADVGTVWPLPPHGAVGWSNDPGRLGRLLLGLACGI